MRRHKLALQRLHQHREEQPGESELPPEGFGFCTKQRPSLCHARDWPNCGTPCTIITPRIGHSLPVSPRKWRLPRWNLGSVQPARDFAAAPTPSVEAVDKIGGIATTLNSSHNDGTTVREEYSGTTTSPTGKGRIWMLLNGFNPLVARILRDKDPGDRVEEVLPPREKAKERQWKSHSSMGHHPYLPIPTWSHHG